MICKKQAGYSLPRSQGAGTIKAHLAQWGARDVDVRQLDQGKFLHWLEPMPIIWACWIKGGTLHPLNMQESGEGLPVQWGQYI